MKFIIKSGEKNTDNLVKFAYSEYYNHQQTETDNITRQSLLTDINSILTGKIATPAQLAKKLYLSPTELKNLITKPETFSINQINQIAEIVTDNWTEQIDLYNFNQKNQLNYTLTEYYNHLEKLAEKYTDLSPIYKKSLIPTYTIAEIAQLTGHTCHTVRRNLRKLNNNCQYSKYTLEPSTLLDNLFTVLSNLPKKIQTTNPINFTTIDITNL